MNNNSVRGLQQHPSTPGEILWQRLISDLRLGYRTIAEDLADLDPDDLEILLGLVIADERVSLDIYANRGLFDEAGIKRFRLTAAYRRAARRNRLMYIERLMERDISSLTALVPTNEPESRSRS